MSGHWAGPEFISTSLTRPQVLPRLLPLSFPIPDTTASFSFLLSSPVILPARLLSLRLPSLYLFLPESVWVSVFGCCSLSCSSSCLGLRFVAPTPHPLPRPLQSRQLGPGAPHSHWPVRSPPPPPARPLQVPPFAQSLALRCGGRGRPGPAQLCPRPARPRPRPQDQPLSDPSSGFKSPGPARRTAPFLTPARPVCPSVPLPIRGATPPRTQGKTLALMKECCRRSRGPVHLTLQRYRGPQPLGPYPDWPQWYGPIPQPPTLGGPKRNLLGRAHQEGNFPKLVTSALSAKKGAFLMLLPIGQTCSCITALQLNTVTTTYNHAPSQALQRVPPLPGIIRLLPLPCPAPFPPSPCYDIHIVTPTDHY